MTDGAICQAPPGTSVRAACRLMAEHQCGSVLVTERGRLLGIFTRGDLVRRVLAPGHDPNLALRYADRIWLLSGGGDITNVAADDLAAAHLAQLYGIDYAETRAGKHRFMMPE